MAGPRGAVIAVPRIALGLALIAALAALGARGHLAAAPVRARAGVAAAARARSAAAAALPPAPEAPGAPGHRPAAPRELPPSPGPVHTSLADARACLALEDGRVLAATGGGLALVTTDGAIERVWTALDGLPETRVHALHEQGGAIWIGTEAGLAEASLGARGLSIRRTFASKPVRAILPHGGELYAATWGDGVARLDRAGARLVPLPYRRAIGESRRASSLAVSGGSLFAGTAGGLFRLAGGELHPASAGLEGASVWALAEHDGRLWIGALDGLSSLQGRELRREGAADVRALSAAGGSLLVGTYGQGLLRRDGDRLIDVSPVSPPRFVQGVGARGETRCAATPEGVAVGRAGGDLEPVRAPALPSNDIATIAVDGSRLWAGTFDRGLAVLEQGRWRAIHDPLVDPKVNAVAVEPGAPGGSRVWVATARGLSIVEGSRIDRLTEADGLPSADVHAVVALREGGALVGTARGAAIVRGDEVTPLGGKRGGLPPGAVWSVAEGPAGTILLGTSRGLHVGPAGGPWTKVSMSTGHLRDDWITALHVRGTTVWVGTYNAGVEELAWDAGTGLSLRRHLGGGYVNLAGILAHDGTLYAATMDGLLARPADAGGGPWRTLERAAPGRDVTALATAAGGLWVASRRGLVRHRGRP